MFIGCSWGHSHAVSLMLNASTHTITPKFQVVHDDNFSTGASYGEVNYSQFLHLFTITYTRMKAFLKIQIIAHTLMMNG